MKRAENLLLSAALAAMVILPLLEALLRKTLGTGISGSALLVQYLTLIVGVLGSAVAARENRLLALSTLGGLLKGRLRTVSISFCGACGAVVATFLAVASLEVVRAERLFGEVLVYGIPVWTVKAILPAGFLVIALRLQWHAATSWTGRVAAVFLAVVVVPLWNHSPTAPFGVLGLATLLGVPAFVSLGGVAVILFQRAGENITAIPIAHYSLALNPVLPTIPMFTLAGYLLAEGGAPKRLINVFQALFGRMPGGAAIVTATVCAFFTTFTGGSGVTIIALGGLLMPVLLARRYRERDALGLITGAGSLGLLFPPCLPLILYAVVANVPIKSMFLGGILPGVLLLVATAIWGIVTQGRGQNETTVGFAWADARHALWTAKWELLIPVVALGALFGGFATPVEASGLTAFYAFCIETFAYRDLKLTTDVPRVMVECGLLVGGILLIQGVALGFTNYLVDSEITMHAAEWATRTIHSKWLFLLAVNLFLLLVGCLMEIYAAIVIQAPLLVSMGLAFHIDPVTLGIVFLANLELGYLTPPIGLNLLMSSYRFRKSVPEVLRATLPLALVMTAGVLLITYVPALTTALPDWFGR